ncbi:MAG TPA: stage II sporulation protein M, partial [Ramlibacter sp.]
MTPTQFEAVHGAAWAELDALLAVAESGKSARRQHWDAPRLATLYRASCEQLALAQARAYPIHLTQQLEDL